MALSAPHTPSGLLSGPVVPHRRRPISVAAARFCGPQASVQFVAFGDMGKAPNCWDGSFEHSWDNPPGPAKAPISCARFLPVSQNLRELASGVRGLACGVLTSPGA